MSLTHADIKNAVHHLGMQVVGIDETYVRMKAAGLAGFPLRVERVEGEIKVMLGRFARVDRAALPLWSRVFHAPTPDLLDSDRKLD